MHEGCAKCKNKLGKPVILTFIFEPYSAAMVLFLYYYQFESGIQAKRIHLGKYRFHVLR